MTALELFRGSLRRWYLTAMGLLMTAALVFSAQPVTVYWTSQVVTLEAPLAREVPRRLGQLDRDPIPAAQMLAELVNERNDLVRSRNRTTTLYGEGVYDGSSARIISEGSQWVTSVRAPSIQVESVSGSASATLARQSREIEVISRTLTELQDRFLVPASQRLSLTLTPAAPTVEMIRGSRTRAGAAFAMVGLVLTLGLVYRAERHASRSGRGAREQD